MDKINNTIRSLLEKVNSYSDIPTNWSHSYHKRRKLHEIFCPTKS